MNSPGAVEPRCAQRCRAAALQLLERTSGRSSPVPMLADACGVHQATIYRRWGGMSTLWTDVVDGGRGGPRALPDTGSLHNNLPDCYAAAVATPLEGRLVPLMLLRAVVQEIRPGAPRRASARPSPDANDGCRPCSTGRRPEVGRTPTLEELLGLVVAPLYFYALFTEPMPAADASRLVDTAPRRRRPKPRLTRQIHRCRLRSTHALSYRETCAGARRSRRPTPAHWPGSTPSCWDGQGSRSRGTGHRHPRRTPWRAPTSSSSRRRATCPPCGRPPNGQHNTMMHFDFQLGDLPSGVASAVALGATLAGDQRPGYVKVLLGPGERHPFCLCRDDEGSKPGRLGTCS